MTRLPTGVVPVTNIEAGLRTFIERGYRPTVRSHALRFTEDFVEDGYAVLSGIKPYLDPEDPPGQRCIGWMVDAIDATGNDRQSVIGGTFPTVGAALAYALRELDVYAPDHSNHDPETCAECRVAAGLAEDQD